MKRRNFIKGMLGTGLVTAGSCVFRVPLVSSAQATPTGMPTVVVIFQRGGCDGLNTVVPYSDGNYYQLRPKIGIPGPNGEGRDAVGDAFPALDLNGTFGLHPSMGLLKKLYDKQKVAVLPAVHYPSASRSHFDSQRYIECGVARDNLGGKNLNSWDGWLNRHLQSSGGSESFQAVGFGGNLAHSLRGSIPVQSFSSINSFNLGLQGAEQQDLIDSVLPVYKEELPSPVSSYRELVHEFGKTLFGNLEDVSSIDTATYIPDNGASYPSGSYGQRLRETAQMIKDEDIGLQIVTVDTGGYDTHSNQGAGEPTGRLSKRLNEFSEGINALVTDLGEKMNDVVIVTMTEFGRTARENGSQGTDHGNASSWFVIGNNIQGGQVYLNGEWPGLGSEQLLSDRYLKKSVDYRDILGEILFNHLGQPQSNSNFLLPEHDYTSLGLFAS